MEDLPPGRMATVETAAGDQIAVYNVNGELFATESLCPHQGAPLAEGYLCGHVVECGLHGWQFDIKTGECLTVEDRIRTFPVTLEEGIIRIHINN